jgi:hypothetical protein
MVRPHVSFACGVKETDRRHSHGGPTTLRNRGGDSPERLRKTECNAEFLQTLNKEV